MPSVYKLKKCPNCNDLHRKRGKYCSQSCSSIYNGGVVSIAVKKHNDWYKNLSPIKKIELQENIMIKQLISKLKDIIKDCNEIITSLEEDSQSQKQYVEDNPKDAHLIKLIYAACPTDYHVDHIIPKARGGKDHQNNFQYLHWQDNLRKQDKLESELKELGEFTLRKIDWIEAMDYDEVNNCYTIKEEWIKEKILSHPLVTLRDKTEQTNKLIDNLIEERNTNYREKLTQEQINLIIELKKEGLTDYKISESLGIDRGTVIKYKRKLGLTGPNFDKRYRIGSK
jgi:hypothetical protein